MASKEDEKINTLNILSQDLLLYITHLEEAFNDIEESEEKTIIQEWLFMILENLHDDVDDARIRNMALSQILMDIESNKMRTPFNQRPSCRSYAELVDWLKSMLNQNASLEIGDDTQFDETREPENREMDVSEFDNLISSDNRTYVAISTLPNGGGLFGYIAVTMGDGIGTQWLDCRGEPIDTPVPFNLHVDQLKADIKESMCDETDAQKVWNVLKNRGPVCLRNDFYDFYKRLYESVQQEIITEAKSCADKCAHPFIKKLLEFLVVDLKAIGVTDLHIYNTIKLLSMLKKQIKIVICQIEKRSDNLEIAKRLSTISPINSLPTKCCYDFISSALWNELHQRRPATKYLNILSYQYPQYFLPKYFTVLMQQKRKVMNCISSKYCNILDEMFADLDESIRSNMMKYKDANWEWHVAREIIEAYNHEKDYKDSLCAVEDSVDESTDSFLTAILNEINMAHLKLKSTIKKNDVLTGQLSALRNEILDKERMYSKIVIQFEEQIDTLKLQINIEKRDIITRENTIAELQRRRKELDK